jgi:lipopolysaccharide transport system ATP-binding protein
MSKPDIIQSSLPSGDEVIVFEHMDKEYEIHGARSGVLRLALTGRAQTQRKRALSDISLRIRRGESVGIVGQNGAGKSTLLKIIAGTLKPSRGHMKIVGRVSAMLELGTGFNQQRTGRENVVTGALCLGITRQEVEERFDSIVAFAELGDWIDEPVRTYSTGMAMRLAFAVATAVDPDIMIVDEAISVGDARFQKKCFSRFEEMRARGVTILVVTHWAELLEMICDRGIYLKGGRLEADGPPKEIVARYNEDLFGPAGGTSNIDSDAEPQEQRYGTQGVRIESVDVLDEGGNRLAVLVPGQPFSIKVGIKCHQDEPVEGLNVGVSISTKEGVRLFAINPILSQQSIPTLHRGDEASITVGMINNLGVGDFFVTVGAWSRFSELHYDRRVDVRHVSVRGDFALSQSLVNMKAVYRIDVQAVGSAGGTSLATARATAEAVLQ